MPHCLILVAAFCGLRMGECLALRSRHVMWDAQRLAASTRRSATLGDALISWRRDSPPRDRPIARLEAGEHNPTIDTLARLAQTLDLEFAIDIHPRERTPTLLNGRARGKNAIASYETDTAAVLLAAG